MFDIVFFITDTQNFPICGVTKITVQTESGLKEFTGDDILTSLIPLATMQVYTNNETYTVAGEKCFAIKLTKTN